MKSFMISSSIRCRKLSKSFALCRPRKRIIFLSSNLRYTPPNLAYMTYMNCHPNHFLIKHGNFYENYALESISLSFFCIDIFMWIYFSSFFGPVRILWGKNSSSVPYNTLQVKTQKPRPCVTAGVARKIPALRKGRMRRA